MNYSNDVNAVHRLAYVPFAIVLVVSMVTIVSIAANVAGNRSGNDFEQSASNGVLLIRDYPVFSQDKNETGSDVELTIEQATKQAWEWVKTGTNSGQAQYYGYARGVLDPWWNQNPVSNELRILRATILQQQHQFAAALGDLNQVIVEEPLNVQAHFTRSAIHLANGNLNAALQDCRAVWLQADAVSVAICISQIKSLQGNSGSMIQLLTSLLAGSELSALQRRELHTSLAELYWAAGDLQSAKKHFGLALLLAPQHSYLVAQYSTLLLQEQHYPELAALLKQQPSTLENRIKLYSVQRHLAHTERSNLKNSIDADIAGMLKDTGSENSKALALYYLLVKPEPATAVHFAQLNWQQQKGMADAMLLLTATEQAENKQAAELVYQWMETQSIKDHRLQQFGVQKNG